MKAILIALAVVASTAAAQPAPRVASSMPPGELVELERIRHAVWVDFFRGDTAALRRVLGPELVAMGDGSPHWQSLGEVLASSAHFKAGGSRLVSVRFDSSTVHRIGDVAVMFSHYALVIARPDGTQITEGGRATEVFARAKTGRWVHTSWQLDKGG